MADYVIGIVGATGVVGRELLALLDERNFPVRSLKLFASEKSVIEAVSEARERLLTEESKLCRP